MDFEFGFRTLWPIATAAFWFWVNGISGRLKEADKRIDDLKEELHAVKLSYHTKADAKADSTNIAAALERIENKTDQTLKNQKEMQAEIAQIRQDTKRTAITFGALGGGVITVGWELLKAKMGL